MPWFEEPRRHCVNHLVRRHLFFHDPNISVLEHPLRAEGNLNGLLSQSRKIAGIFWSYMDDADVDFRF